MAVQESDPVAHVPQKWWQWFIVYPSIGVALISSLPNVYDKVGAAYANLIRKPGQQAISSIGEAEDQKKMWLENKDCNTLQHAWVPTQNLLKVDTTICPRTGDVLVQALTQSNQQFQRWVSSAQQVIKLESPSKQTDVFNAAGIFSTANAATRTAIGLYRQNITPVQYQQILCQRQIDFRTLLRRFGTPQGCFDVIIDMYTGQVYRQVPAPCVPQC